MRKLLVVLLCFVFLISMAAAVPADTIIHFSFDSGYEIATEKQTDLEVNKSFSVNFFVFNKTTGMPIDNVGTSCVYYLANDRGVVQFYETADYVPTGYWGVDLDGGNFSSLGEYNFGIKCNSTTQGGSLVGIYEVTPLGSKIIEGQGNLYLLFFLGALLLFGACLTGAIVFPWSNNFDGGGRIISINHFKYLKIMFIAFTYVVFLFIMGLLRGITANLIPEIGVDKLFNWAYWILLYCMWPLIIIFAILGVVHYLEDRKLSEALARGVPLR